jgi:hypothetical protein
MNIRLLRVVISLAGVAACSSKGESHDTSAAGGGDGGPQIVCPVSESGTFEDTPTGACTGVGSCAFQIDPVCRPGLNFIPSTAPVFECACVSNQWQCTVVSGGAGLVPCGDAGAP